MDGCSGNKRIFHTTKPQGTGMERAKRRVYYMFLVVHQAGAISVPRGGPSRNM
jgi:hypothetical protein